MENLLGAMAAAGRVGGASLWQDQSSSSEGSDEDEDSSEEGEERNATLDEAARAALEELRQLGVKNAQGGASDTAYVPAAVQSEVVATDADLEQGSPVAPKGLAARLSETGNEYGTPPAKHRSTNAHE